MSEGTVRATLSLDTSRLEERLERVADQLARVKRLAWWVDLMESREANEVRLAEASGLLWEPHDTEGDG